MKTYINNSTYEILRLRLHTSFFLFRYFIFTLFIFCYYVEFPMSVCANDINWAVDYKSNDASFQKMS
jgi:hypothetical protein